MMAKIEWYEEILALEPGSKVFFPFAKRLAEDGLHDKALAVLRHGLVQHPEYLEARVFLTHLLFAVGDTESAMTESQQVFARLAPYPAFWEALSLANEAIPGDMALIMRFMAEALRTPGLSFAATLRRGLAPQGSQPVATEESSAVTDATEQPADLPETALATEQPADLPETPLADVELLESAPAVAEAQPELVSEPLPESLLEPLPESLLEPLPESLAEPLADPLDPVESEVELPEESGYAGFMAVDALLPLDDDDQPELPVLGEVVPPTAELVVENVEKVLAAAASVDEVLAELVDSQTPDAGEPALAGGLVEPGKADAQVPDSEEPPLLSLKDLEELGKALFEQELPAEADESGLMPADTENAIETVPDRASLPELTELTELIDLEDPIDPIDPTDVEPLSVASGDEAEAIDAAEVTEAAEAESQADVASAEKAEPAENAGDGEEVEPSAPEFVETAATFLDGGLLDFEDFDDAMPGMSPIADGADALEPREQVEDPKEQGPTEPEAAEPETEDAAPDKPSAAPVHIDPTSPYDSHDVDADSIADDNSDVLAAELTTEQVNEQPEVSAEPAAETTDESDDTDIPDDGPVRTRSMADVLAEQGDIDGALVIYEELLHKVAPDEAASIGVRMEALRGQKAVEKAEPKPATRAEKEGLRSMLENLAGRLEKRAKA